GLVVIDGVKRKVRPGDVVEIPVGTRHTLCAGTALKVIEVQIGEEIDVHDKIKYEEPFTEEELKASDDNVPIMKEDPV
ncbi:MAG: hypothetical protein IK096_03735, partial [Lachnospiraceae bacterium]|nr:hypothetical protein [Lachnospiraceae bacterium]